MGELRIGSGQQAAPAFGGGGKPTTGKGPRPVPLQPRYKRRREGRGKSEAVEGDTVRRLSEFHSHGLPVARTGATGSRCRACCKGRATGV